MINSGRKDYFPCLLDHAGFPINVIIATFFLASVLPNIRLGTMYEAKKKIMAEKSSQFNTNYSLYYLCNER
jgi:hypothetical protein